jgi:hypothetical protein
MSFDQDFASAADWACAYRALRLNVIPASAKKHPVARWGEFQDNLTPDAVFARWYGDEGEHRASYSMGFLTGSGCLEPGLSLLVIDVDAKEKDGRETWAQWLAVHANGMEPDTWRARTGSGGRHIYFSYPSHLHIHNTQVKFHGIDTRAQGGFIMAPPSPHQIRGTSYEWEAGCNPLVDDVDLAPAPDWLIEIAQDIGSADSPAAAPRGERTEATTSTDPWGNRTDGREAYMRDMVWAAVVDLRRQNPAQPDRDTALAKMQETYEHYARRVRTRFPGEANEIGLEREGRGLSLFQVKWDVAMRQWNTKVAAAALVPRPLDQAAVEAVEAEQRAIGPSGNLLLPASEFVAAFTPPSYLIDGVVQRGYLYSLTARTGHGKTAVDLYLCQCVARGVPAHNRKTAQGSVLFCAGENADDIRARWIVLADAAGFDIAKTPVYFIDGIIDIKASTPRIVAEANAIADLVLVIVDTAAAYFRGDDPNNNAQQVAFARDLRLLTVAITSKPALIVNCHPVKNASKDNLIPMGGSALLNEVDGNLTLWADGDGQTAMHWQGKFRGPEFEPMLYKIETVFSDRVVDADGRKMPSVVAGPMGELEAERVQAAAETDEDLILAIVGHNKGCSVSAMARKASWTTAAGVPHKSKVARVLARLESDKLIARYRGTKYAITDAGKRALGWADE